MGIRYPRTRTSAEIVSHPPDPFTPAIALTFRAQLFDARSVDIGEDVVVDWQQVGGVSPIPFNILIPAGCFVPIARGLHVVDDFRDCGVEITVVLGDGTIALSIREFQARFVPPSPVRDRIARARPARLDIKTVFTDSGQESAILGALGASVVEIVIGAESATSPIRSIDAVSGISPIPF